VGVALKHALRIVERHGNLEVPLDAQRTDGELDALEDERRVQPPYCHRSLLLEATLSPAAAEFTIAHEGQPIDISRLPTDASSIAADRIWLGSFLMIRSIMTEVEFEPCGQRLRLLRLPQTTDGDLEISIAD
jgi:hypothetical protein